MKRIIVAEIMHESSSLAKYPTEEENFRRTLMWYEKDDVLKLSDIGFKDYLTGILEGGKDAGLEIAPSFCAFASPSGVISATCFETLLSKLFEGIDDSKPIDGFCLAIHGAGVSEKYPDIEGEILRRIRAKYGNEVPIFFTLDPHANITPQMVELATIMMPSKLYPHTDSYETGRKLSGLLSQMLEGKKQPVQYVSRLPLLIPITMGCTYEDPMKAVLDMTLEAEKIDGVIDCSFAHGFPYSDIKECCASVVVTTNNDMALAEKIAKEIGDYVMENRKKFVSNCLTVTEGVDLAERVIKEKGGLVVMNEASDNPGAGTPGDATYLLRELLHRDLPKTCIGAIIDPETVKIAVASGVGTTVDVKIGGKTDDLHGTPVEVQGAYVKSICDGKYNLLSAMSTGQPCNFGTTVRLQKGNVDIVVASNGYQIMDDGVFTLLGIKVREYNILAVKSAQHFKSYFKPISQQIITVDPPGISTGNIEILPLKNVPRPIFPLDNV